MKNVRPDFLFKQSICSQDLWCHWRMTMWRGQLVFTPLRNCSWTSENSSIIFASHALQGERKSHQSFTWYGSCPAPHLLWERSGELRLFSLVSVAHKLNSACKGMCLCPRVRAWRGAAVHQGHAVSLLVVRCHLAKLPCIKVHQWR